MIGQDILTYIEARIVMDELVGENGLKHNDYKPFDMVILNHQIYLFGNLMGVECLFYNDNSGGQVRFTGLNDLLYEFFKAGAEGFRHQAMLNTVTVYIDDEMDEVKMYNWLEDIYMGRNPINAVS